MGPIINTIIGAGIKLGCNLINHWLEQKKLEIQYLHARDDKIMELVAEQNRDTRSDPFVKVTRRILFMSLTFTYCFLMIYYALNPGIQYDVLVPNGSSNGIFGWFVGADTFDTVTLTGGLLLMTFTDLIFMVVGFYSIPSKRYK
jgi:hypothetical protein